MKVTEKPSAKREFKSLALFKKNLKKKGRPNRHPLLRSSSVAPLQSTDKTKIQVFVNKMCKSILLMLQQ